MRKARNIKILPLLMTLTILAIAAFQLYWLQKAYEREKRNLDMRSIMIFRETVRSVQASKLKLDRFLNDSGKLSELHNRKYISTPPVHHHFYSNHDQKMINMVDLLMQRVKDSVSQKIVINNRHSADTQYIFNKNFSGRSNRLIQFLFDIDSLQDSVKVNELDIAFSRRLEEQGMKVPFKIGRVHTTESDEPVFNEVTLGFSNPITYRLDLGNTFPFLIKRITVPILFSVFLVGFTILSFLLLYRNLVKQNRLSNIKNEFISNITHELKTPIATVSVAIEALRSFNATIDPQKTKEYLDISANELLRLSLLVDKVLKLSMFEKKEIELKYELLDMKELVKEVTSSMRLQFEKHHATINIVESGDTSMEGDRLHLVSVLFNLFDNALKYSTEKPLIEVIIKGIDNKVSLVISDTGIGIPAEYHHRIFEKFFRVPTGNLHNAKGYGLGLSYVAHVIKKHKGTIKVESVEGDGSKFIIQIPKSQQA